MPTEPTPPTLADAVRRAVAVCEVGEVDELLDELDERFEDDDEPVRAVGDVESRLDEVVRDLDPEGDSPSLAMARAVAVYLAFRRDELDAPPETLLRLAARAEFHGHPPPAVKSWLEAAGVEV